mmetsp:Transcript_21046/g.43260  ORF Transcript_21046/g.43260 Transcript_21046/m.43260 type:complete len:100 (-) Transcript_21046:419-718(-)
MLNYSMDLSIFVSVSQCIIKLLYFLSEVQNHLQSTAGPHDIVGLAVLAKKVERSEHIEKNRVGIPPWCHIQQNQFKGVFFLSNWFFLYDLLFLGVQCSR